MSPRLPEAAFENMVFSGDGWRLTAEGDALDAPHLPAVFALGNGFIGLRGPGEAEDAPRVYLNGVFERVPIDYHEAAHGYARESDTRLAVADATRIAITIDGEAIDTRGTTTLDLRAGILVREIEHPRATIRIERLVSMARPALIATRLTIVPGADCTIGIETGVQPPPGGEPAEEAEDAVYDPRVAPGLGPNPWTDTGPIAIEGRSGRIDRLARSGFAVAAIASGSPGVCEARGGATQEIALFAAYRASRTESDAAIVAAAVADLDAAEAAGFDALRAEQAAWFDAFWADAEVRFPRVPQAERAARHGLFQLVQAAGRDGATSISAKGQTGEGYEGHVFWDADSYVLPVFAHIRPEIARAMLAWRIAGLDAARANARDMGHRRGALYPWRTIAGRECSAFFPAGSAQYHINADIAHALMLYVEATGDRSILSEGGAELLAETARIWLQIGFHDPERADRFVINRVTGPDEYTALVDNNLYTNMMAAEHLRHAAAHARDHLTTAEIAAMERAADAMLLPRDEARGIFAQDDAFFARQPWPFTDTPDADYPLLLHYHPLTIYRHQVSKQADAVLATVFLRDSFDQAMRRRMLDAYEAVTVHDSTLSASAFASAAASVGDAGRAWRYWRVTVLTDLANLFGNSDHGLHMAALAGSWTALAMGFGGMRTTGGRLSFAPIAVPALGEYAFRARFRGRSIDVAVADDRVTYRLIAGDPVTLSHDGEEIALGDTPVERAVAA